MHKVFWKMDLDSDSPDQIKSTLTLAFGHASDAQFMVPEVVDGGDYGLAHFFDLYVLEVLNEVDRPDYHQVYCIFEAVCAALGQKCEEHIQVLCSSFPCLSPHSDAPRHRQTVRS